MAAPGREGDLFVTGFPGFLAGGLVPRLLEDRPGAEARCLVLTREREAARRRREALVAARPELEGRLRLVEGDITRPDLGLDPEEAEVARGRTTELFHLAALYDLEASLAPCREVNVRGTRNVLDFAASLPDLARLHYVSTCYVAGRHAGTFREEDLEMGQGFRNAYERTKYEAEVAVRDRQEEGLPVTIYRPSVVVGDSRTGHAPKMDGPYPVIRWILRQPGAAVVPVPADPEANRVNLVPCDFVADALAWLSREEETVGKTYHLCDPEPPTVAEVMSEVGKAAGRRVFTPRVGSRLLKGTLRRMPGARRLTGISPALVDYFHHPTDFGTRNAGRDLERAGIRPPEFGDYVEAMVEFVRRESS